MIWFWRIGIVFSLISSSFARYDPAEGESFYCPGVWFERKCWPIYWSVIKPKSFFGFKWKA